MSTVVQRCQACTSVDLGPHCVSDDPNHPCDLLRCGNCAAFGTRDGRRWTKKVKMK